MKTLLSLLLASISTFAATEVHSWGILGPRGGFRGSTVYVNVTVGWFQSQVATVNTSTNVITAPGTNYTIGVSPPATSTTILFWPASGGTLPAGLNPHLSYSVCSKPTTESFTVALTLVGSCAVARFGADDGDGTWKVGTRYGAGSLPGADHIYLSNVSLPPGVTITSCQVESSTLPNCFVASEPTEYYSYAGAQVLRLGLTIDPAATPGDYTFSATWHCRTSNVSGCVDVPVSIPFKIEALTPLTRNPPTSFPAISGKATWQAALLAGAAEFCPDRANGTVNWGAPGAFVFGSSGESTIWYYDGAATYVRIAEYTGDPTWKNCAKTIANEYNRAILAQGTPGSFQLHRWFPKGARLSTMFDRDMHGRRAIERTQANNGGAFSGGVNDIIIRETAYSLTSSIEKARYSGWEKMHYVADSALKARIQRLANQLMGILYSYSSEDAGAWDYVQSFMAGLGMRAAIDWYLFADDERVPVLNKRILDMLYDTMRGLDDENPTDIAWMRGERIDPPNDGGPKCGYNCLPHPARELHGMFVPAAAWLWAHTGDDTLRTKWDPIFNYYITIDATYQGKAFNEALGLWSMAYIDWREGRRPLLP